MVDKRTLALLLERRRRMRHKLNNYQPGATALLAHQSNAPRKLVTGPSRGGKSYSTGQDIGWSVTATHPYKPNITGERMFLFCLSRAQANLVWRPMLLGKDSRPGVVCDDGFIPPWEIAVTPRGKPDVSWDHNNGMYVPKSLRMRNGNELSLWWHGDPNAWQRFQGIPFLRGWIDECGDHTDNLVQEIGSRFMDCMSKYGSDACYAWWAATDTTANEQYAQWMDRGLDPDDALYEAFILKPGENPGITNEARAITAATMLNQEDADVRVWGTRTRGDDKRILTTFSRVKHIRSEPYMPSDRDNLILAYDPGLKDDTGILFAYVGPHNVRQLNIVNFWTIKDASVKGECEYVKEWLRGRKIRFIAYDKNSCLRKEKGLGMNLLAQLKEHLNEPEIWHDGEMHFKPPKGQIPAGIKRCMSYLEPPESVSTEPLIMIDPPTPENGLNKFCNELQQYRLRATASNCELRSHNIYPKNNEGPDLLRYLVMCSPVWQDLGINRCKVMSPIEAAFAEKEAQILSESELMYREKLRQSSERWQERKKRIAAARRSGRKITFT